MFSHIYPIIKFKFQNLRCEARVHPLHRLCGQSPEQSVHRLLPVDLEGQRLVDVQAEGLEAVAKGADGAGRCVLANINGFFIGNLWYFSSFQILASFKVRIFLLMRAFVP